MLGKIVSFVIFSALALIPQQLPQRDVPAPSVDHHQHLYSPEISGSAVQPLDAADLIAYLDAAGIRRAAVLSIAYQFGNPNRPAVEDEYNRVKAENDWTSRQVARFPDRLRGLCGVNPLRDYALTELERCAGDPNLHAGLKLHFGNSDVDLDNAANVEQLRCSHARIGHETATVRRQGGEDVFRAGLVRSSGCARATGALDGWRLLRRAFHG